MFRRTITTARKLAQEAAKDKPFPPPTAIKFPKVVDKSALTPEQRKKIDAQAEANASKQYTPAERKAIDSTTSSLYTPENPLEVESQADQIRERLKSIEQRIQRQKLAAEEKLRRLEEERTRITKPKVSDFKRPIASFLLLAFSTYMLMQYAWYSMDGEFNMENQEAKTRQYEKRIQSLLDEQRQLVEKDRQQVGWWQTAWNKLGGSTDNGTA